MGVQVPPRTPPSPSPCLSAASDCGQRSHDGSTDASARPCRRSSAQLEPGGSDGQGPAELGPDEIYRACDPSVRVQDHRRLPELDRDHRPGPGRILGGVRHGDRQRRLQHLRRRTHGHGQDHHGLRASFPGEAASLPAPDDWVYVHNFAKPYQPNAIRMPAGKGQEFRKDMEKLVEDLQAAITQAFESEEYEKQKREIAQQVSEQQEAKLEALSQKAESRAVHDGAHARRSGLRAQEQPTARPCRARPTRPCREEQKRIDDGLESPQRGAPADHAAGAPGRACGPRGPAGARPAGDHLRRPAPGRRGLRALVRRPRDGRLPAGRPRRTWWTTPTTSRSRTKRRPAMFMGMPISGRQKGEGAFRKYRINVLVDNSGADGRPGVTESNP